MITILKYSKKNINLGKLNKVPLGIWIQVTEIRKTWNFIGSKEDLNRPQYDRNQGSSCVIVSIRAWSFFLYLPSLMSLGTNIPVFSQFSGEKIWFFNLYHVHSWIKQAWPDSNLGFKFSLLEVKIKKGHSTYSRLGCLPLLFPLTSLNAKQ